jgi:hypothetical protein
MTKDDLEKELTGLKDLHEGLASGSMTIRRAGVDISQREIDILKRRLSRGIWTISGSIHMPH